MSKYIREGEVAERMAELMEPINKQILMCDNREDLLMLACAMVTLVRSIFDQELGEDGRKKMFKDLV
jgi:hypothetical protein|tara:strand:+ start:2425 stop:2625 length:201 start_codon:yes stop_codon:yes gene_type:complete